MFGPGQPDVAVWCEFAGIVGFGLYVLNYTLLTFNVVTNQCVKYFILNLCAAVLVLAGLSVSFNLAAAMIQLFWIFLSTIGILMRLRRQGPYPPGVKKV